MAKAQISLQATELKSEYETMRLFWLINQRPEHRVLLTLNNCLCGTFLSELCNGADSVHQNIKRFLTRIWLLGIWFPPLPAELCLVFGALKQSFAQREENYSI